MSNFSVQKGVKDSSKKEVIKRTQEQEPQPRILVRYGPPKNLARAQTKSPATLVDLNRATFSSPDPYMLAVVHQMLRKKFGVLSVKNQYGDGFKPHYNPTLQVVIDMNGTGYAAEIMLMLEAFVEIKKAMHVTYDIGRANCIEDVLSVLPHTRT